MDDEDITPADNILYLLSGLEHALDADNLEWRPEQAIAGKRLAGNVVLKLLTMTIRCESGLSLPS